MTEPDAGSDTAAASTRAVKEGDQWVINGSKMFITDGNLANWVILFALYHHSAPISAEIELF
ncbi:MAG: acyl-CoA dehydrogenase family protein [Deltaproteobacteria bacterium]|nr:MAG: acyl-CoA dehydrogenase family protein [Deltaproteobacteria bacterium]